MNARKSVLILMLACAALVSCSSPAQDQDATSSTSSNTGTDAQGTTGILKISLTDAPPVLNIEKALVTISTVQVHRAGKDEASDAETEAGWFTVVETPQTFDLILLRDAKTVLGSAELEPGKYTQIRLKVEEAVATIEGTEHTLKVPSGAIKLVHPFTIEASHTTELILDFDAEKSIHAAGEKYIMRPTIKVTIEGPTS